MKLNKISLLTAILASTLLVGCASTSTDDSDAAATAAEQAAMERAAAEAEAARLEAARLEALRLADAAANLQTVFYFDFDQATLTASSRAALDAQIAVLKGTNAKVRLEGHADERGTRDYNMALGERRANAVANYLVINGVARYRIEAISYGEEQPALTGSSESAWNQNRRVELK